jgi:hypothetical protein
MRSETMDVEVKIKAKLITVVGCEFIAFPGSKLLVIGDSCIGIVDEEHTINGTVLVEDDSRPRYVPPRANAKRLATLPSDEQILGACSKTACSTFQLNTQFHITHPLNKHAFGSRIRTLLAAGMLAPSPDTRHKRRPSYITTGVTP